MECHGRAREESAQALHQKCFALNIDVDGHASARARIAGADYSIMEVTLLPDSASGHAPGSLIAQDADGMIVVCGDGTARVVTQPLGSLVD